MASRSLSIKLSMLPLPDLGFVTWAQVHCGLVGHNLMDYCEHCSAFHANSMSSQIVCFVAM